MHMDWIITKLPLPPSFSLPLLPSPLLSPSSPLPPPPLPPSLPLPVNKIGIPLLKKELSKINIPDVSGKADIKIGKVKYNLKKLVES